MDKNTERWIIVILFVVLLVAGLSGCANKSKEKANMPNISVYDGSLSKILGCMFSPTACEDIKKAQQQNSNQTKEEADEEFTKEFDQIDEDLNKE